MKRTGIRRGKPLKANPETTQAWVRRSRAKPARNKRTQDESDSYAGLRAEAYQRARGVCQADGCHAVTCSGSVVWSRGHVHHLLPRSKGGLDEIGNLVWLFPDCHLGIHSRPARSASLGLLINK